MKSSHPFVHYSCLIEFNIYTDVTYANFLIWFEKKINNLSALITSPDKITPEALFMAEVKCEGYNPDRIANFLCADFWPRSAAWALQFCATTKF